MKQLKLKNQWKEFTAGSEIEVDEKVADSLLVADVAENYTMEDVDKYNAQLKDMEKMVAGQLEKALIKMPAVRLQVEEKKEEPRFKSLGEQFIDIAKGAPVTRKSYHGNIEGTDSLGGYLVDTDFANVIMDHIVGESVIWPRTQKFPISANSNGVKVPGFSDYNKARGSRAVEVRGVTEGDDKAQSTPQFEQISLDLKKISRIFIASDELLMDAPLLEAAILRQFDAAYGFELDWQILRGSGAGNDYQGILNHASLALVSRNTAGTVSTADVQNMYARMLPGSVKNAIWLINQDVWPALFGLTLGNYPVYTPPIGGLSAAPFGTLMGRPVFPVESCATLGNQGDIVFMDPTYYFVATKGGMQFAKSIHVHFISDETTFRVTLRSDGTPGLSTVITPCYGTSTLSSNVALTTTASS